MSRKIFQPDEYLRQFLHTIGVDRSVGYAVLGNVTSFLIGPVTALLIASHFSPELQGYYYTFGSLTSFQFLLDMGLGQALILFASHEWSKLSLDKTGAVVGEEEAKSRLRSLGCISLKWYSGAAILFLLVLAPLGHYFFNKQIVQINWVWPWNALCAGVAMNIILIPVFSLLQGCNQVSQFWFYRLIQQVVNGLTIWAAIIFGAGLWTLSLATVAGLIWSGIFLERKYRGLIFFFLQPASTSQIRWKSDVWPVQWRISISWAGAYFTIFLFTPIMFQLSGPVVAGKMGMTVTLTSVILAVSSNWVITKAPHFGVLISRGNFEELDRLFWRVYLVSLIVAIFGASFATLCVIYLSHFQHSLSDRILPPLPTFFLLAGMVLNNATLGLAVYLRAHKSDPLAGVYLATGMLVILIALILAKPFGAVGVTLGYLAGVACVQLPLAIFVFRQSRKISKESRTRLNSCE